MKSGHIATNDQPLVTRLLSPDRAPQPPDFLATSIPGVFAVGDLRAGSMKRVASASDEGASVVPLIHAWLTAED